MGLELAHQNAALQERLQSLEADQSDMHQRMGLIERDRRWMQEQSLRVDQIRATLNELVTKADGTRSRRESSDQRVDHLDYIVEKLKEDVESLAQTVDSSVSMRKWTAESGATHRAIDDVSDKVAMLDARLVEMEGQVSVFDGRHRSQTTELSRTLGETMRQVQEIAELRNEAQVQIDSVASNQRNIEQSLQSVIYEYNAMLNDHEQAIRLLGESQSMLEVQSAVGARPLPARNATRSDVSRKQSRFQRTYPNSARPSLQQCESLDDIFANDRACQSSGTSGSSLDDIFANDRAYRSNGTSGSSCPPPPPAGSGVTALPSPPLSTSPASAVRFEGTPLRKAASVVGTPNKPRVRPRVSSFSKLTTNPKQNTTRAQILVSPTRMASGFSNIISTTSHVGVGWGNYWEARRHRLQFDIQKRFGLSATTRSSCKYSAKNQTGDVEELDVQD
ncbi:hypothetical protein LPJ81_005431 [Coemansia sp. IMI 209127]|nr:hypothetical protein LPJ81_005431 [Coemansia sp. IMI 209127]